MRSGIVWTGLLCGPGLWTTAVRRGERETGGVDALASAPRRGHMAAAWYRGARPALRAVHPALPASGAVGAAGRDHRSLRDRAARVRDRREPGAAAADLRPAVRGGGGRRRGDGLRRGVVQAVAARAGVPRWPAVRETRGGGRRGARVRDRGAGGPAARAARADGGAAHRDVRARRPGDGSARGLVAPAGAPRGAGRGPQYRGRGGAAAAPVARA